MLRPEQMSKVSVTGSKRVVDDVIEATYEQHALHVEDYDGSWERFSQGESLTGADAASEKLVTVRSLESILDVDEDDAGPRRVLDDEEIEAELADVRDRVNELDDRRTELEAEIRELEEEIERMEPFADLGIDLDLLSGYETLEVVVGEGKPEDVERALVDADRLGAYEVFSGTKTVAVFGRPAKTAAPGVVADELVGVDFTVIEIPDAEGSPEEYVRQLRQRQRELETKLDRVESELEEVKTEAAGFLLAAEEQLTVEAQKKQAPLSFATTENAFVAEGWIPTERYTEFAGAIQSAVGDHVDVDEVRRATFTPEGDHHTEPTRDEAGEPSPSPATDGSGSSEGASAEGGAADSDDRRAVSDGGHTMGGDEPPVVQDNPTIASPFEVLVTAVNRPNYREFDPTIFLFLTFPLMFGFMIGDIGYGILYTAIGWYLYDNYESPAMTSMGGVAMWAGGFTILFGLIYGGDFFGYHLLDTPFAKGIAPGEVAWARAWLVVAVLFGVLHLNIGYVLSFLEEKEFHGLEDAMYESGSWLLLLNGFWLWVFSRHAAGGKPDFVFESIELVFGIPFGGFPVVVGYLGLLAVFAGIVLLWVGARAELAEVLSPLVNVLSYARITAVLLAKAGMAVAANLLAFGAALDDHGHFKFLFTNDGLQSAQESGYEVIFAGMTTSAEFPILGLIAGILVAVVGHILVLLLGITAAGIQGIRLEYVEFFGKFYEGGGKEYEPFGIVRKYTTEE